ncbi:MAG: DUF3179 domain-containing protein [Cellulomonas sp.]
MTAARGRGPVVRYVAVGVGAMMLVSACAGPASPPPPATPPAPVVNGSPREDVLSALRDGLDQPGLPAPLVDATELVSGGPPPDGIPSLDQPAFVDPADAHWLAAEEPVLALELDGEHRAYPVQIMIWHEIVNDEVAGTPVAVTYCPLCNSALAFDRRVGDRVLGFGVSGLLYRSDLVMYDRQTESLWSQIEGRAIAGHLTGRELDRIAVQTVPWDRWRTAHPDGQVLSQDTGFERDYGRNPYVGYDDATDDPFAFDGDPDPRLAPKERVVGLGDVDGDPVALVAASVASARVVAVTVGGEPVVLLATAGLRSALDTEDVAAGRLLAATGAFDPVLGERHLDFTPADAATFVDAQTSSTWDILGRAVAGPLAGQSLRPVPHLDTFWFAWAAFHPDTRLIEPVEK